MGATLEIQRQQQMEQLEQQLAWAQFQQGPAPRVRRLKWPWLQIPVDFARNNLVECDFGIKDIITTFCRTDFSAESLEAGTELMTDTTEVQSCWLSQCCTRKKSLQYRFISPRCKTKNFARFAENVQAARTPPTEDNINQLVEMGFNRNSVMNALTSTNNDMSLATNVLLQES